MIDLAQYEAVQADAAASRARRAAEQHERSMAAAARELGRNQGDNVTLNQHPPPGLTTEQLEQLMAEVVALLRREIAAELVAPLEQRIAELEARPVLQYCGIWKTGETYAPGTLITTDGSLWLKVEAGDEDVKPGNGRTTWKLVDKGGLEIPPRFATHSRTRSSNSS